MKKILFLTALSLSLLSYGYELEGVWQEDVEKTIKWNKSNRVVDEDYLNKMRAIMGHMWISYSETDWCLFHEPYEHYYSGEKRSVSRMFTQNGKYKVIAQNEYGYVIESIFDNGHKNIEMIIFENDQSIYSAQLTTEDFGHPGSRVYFKRVAPVKWSYDCE